MLMVYVEVSSFFRTGIVFLVWKLFLQALVWKLACTRKYYLLLFILSCHLGVVIGFERPNYFIDEDEGSVTVCATVQTNVNMESRTFL